MGTTKLEGVNPSIYVGLQDQVLPKLSSLIKGQQVCVVTNELVASHYLPLIQAQLLSFQCDVLILPDGEKHKNWDTLEKILNHLFLHEHQRTTTIIALGGGVILDIAGFAASCYQRGVAFISIPTSLLAQVDAAMGGKTGINFHHAKNMIGAFYPPQAIMLCPEFLLTLPEREFRAGLAEMIKHALIADKSYFEWLDMNLEKILQRDLSLLKQAISKNAAIKCRIVQLDQKEQGLRVILNFGHTLGHALEAATEYDLLHGEAVALGMVMELDFSNAHGLSDQVNLKVKNLLQRAGLPIILPNKIKDSDWKKWITHDKKTRNDKILLPLLSDIGSAYVKSLPIETINR